MVALATRMCSLSSSPRMRSAPQTLYVKGGGAILPRKASHKRAVRRKGVAAVRVLVRAGTGVVPTVAGSSCAMREHAGVTNMRVRGEASLCGATRNAAMAGGRGVSGVASVELGNWS